MPRKVGWAVAALAQLAALVVTAFPPFSPNLGSSVEPTHGLGVPTWHHNASLLAAALFVAAFWRRFNGDRRFLGYGVLVTTVLALASAFLLLYLKQDLKATGLKDWAKFWHVAWSWFALAFFAFHTWVNRGPLARSLRRLRRGAAGKVAFDGVNLLILVAIPLTWSPWGARVFTDPVYIPLTLYTWLAFLVPSYGAWVVAKVRARSGPPFAWSTRSPTVAFVDGWLFPMTVLANVTGFPILYFGTKDTALKYVAKYWHTWPSIAMAILVFAHSVQFWSSFQRYGRTATSLPGGAKPAAAASGKP